MCNSCRPGPTDGSREVRVEIKKEVGEYLCAYKLYGEGNVGGFGVDILSTRTAQ